MEYSVHDTACIDMVNVPHKVIIENYPKMNHPKGSYFRFLNMSNFKKNKRHGYCYDIFAPYIAFPFLFLICYLLSLFRISTQIKSFGVYTHIYIIFSFFLYLIACFITLSIEKVKHQSNFISSPFRLKTVHYIVYFISLATLGYEYIDFGAIPVLLPNFETERLEFMKSGYIHLIAMTTMPVLVIFATNLLYNYSRYKYLKKILLAALILLAVFAIIGLGNRGQLAIVASIILIYRHYSVKMFTVTQATVGVIMGILLLSYMKFIREFIMWGECYASSLHNTLEVNVPVWLVPGYLTLTMNFQIFSELVRALPDGFGVTYGRFIMNPLISLWPGPQENFGDFTNKALNTGFYGSLTNTYLGIPYVDFGIIGIMFVPFILGIIMSKLYLMVKKNPSHLTIIIYSYFTTNMLLCVYTYPFQSFNFFWMLTILYVLGKVVEPKRSHLVKSI